MKLVLASNNTKKLKELDAILAPLDWQLIPQGELGVPEAEEPYCTFVENALAKARHASRLTGLPALADDSGLCVDAFGGAPGVQSARYAGEPRSDSRNNQKLLFELGDNTQRMAHFVSLIVFVRHADDPQPIIAEGEWHGEILSAARGDDGFGYDPLFYIRELDRTAAELDAAEKNRRSHRAQALARLVERLQARATFTSTLMPGSRSRMIIPLLPQARLAAPKEPGPRFRSPPPLSLYVHIPWCVQKCPYCDFNSHSLPVASSSTAPTAIPESDYLAALVADLESALPLVWGRRIDSLFFGGGTPSLLSGAGLDQLLAALRSRLTFLPGAEITLEANPGTVEAARFAAFRDAGINRLSLGIQSFNPQHLKALGRIHDDHEARRAITIAARHFDNFNLDLMYGLPGQTLAEALADLDAALAFSPPHLSCYQLTIEANTAFAARPPALPEDDLCADMQDAIEARLAAAGYLHYETSAFARPGRQCQHNLNYWHFGDYLGIGAGAHGKLTLHDRVLRQMRWKGPEQYLAQVAAGMPVQEEFAVAAADLPFEFMLNALRLVQGFDAPLFESRTALSLLSIEGKLRQAEQEGLIERQRQRIVPSEHGRRFLNRLLMGFLAGAG